MLIRFLSWVVYRALLLEVKVIKFTFSKAAWASSLGTAVVIQILSPVSLVPRIFFSSSQYLCTQVVGSCFVVSYIFMETVPERCRCTNRKKKSKLSFEYTCSIICKKWSQRRVRNTLVNCSTAQRSNCRSWKSLVLDFTVLVVSG